MEQYMANRVIHTSNKFGKVIVKYEKDNEILTRELNVNWYFAVLRKDVDRTKDVLLQRDLSLQMKLDEKFPDYVKIYYSGDDKYDIVQYLEQNGIGTFEGDLKLDRRFYIDQEVEISDKFDLLYFDVETDDSNDKLEIGRDRILSWAAIDSKGKKYFEKLKDFTDKSEERILSSFLRTITKYDIIVGWNSKGFDIPYLKIRMEKYGLHGNWGNVGHYDLLKRFRHIFRFDSHLRTFSLDFIANHFLEKGKIHRTERVIDLWKNNQQKLKEYNTEDSVLVKELDEKLGVSAMMIRQSQWCGVPPSQFGLYSIIDAHILKTAHKMGKFCRTSLTAIQERSKDNIAGNEDPDDTKTKKSKYTGALVLDPVVGFYRGVHTFDFKGLYPSMMRTSNIGYDTLRDTYSDGLVRNPGTSHIPRKYGGLKPTYFAKEPSVINVAITELITKRTEYKKLKLQMIEEGKNKGPKWESVVSDEIIVKELANSTYGIMGLEYGRYFSIDVAESITLFGQWCILFAKKFFEDQGYLVCYGDTDSVFVVGDLDITEQLKNFHSNLNMTLKDRYNIDESFIELEFDKRYETFLLIDKKKYVGHVTNIEGKKTNEIYARGLEYHKKDTFSFVKDKQKELVEFILFNEPTRDQLRNFMFGIKEDFDKKNFTKDELVITKKVGKDFDEYVNIKSAPLHVRLANRIKEEFGRSLVKSEVEYIITEHDGKLQGVFPEEYTGKHFKEYYWTNLTRESLERVANTQYPGFDFFDKNLTLF